MKDFNKAILMTLILICFHLPIFTQSVTLNINNVTVKEAMEQLRKTSGYSFVFLSSDVNTKKKITVSANDKDIKDVAEQILKGQDGLEYEINNKEIVVRKINAISLYADQKIIVKGKVVDENGEPVIGASVLEKGTANGTITDIEGNFSLNVSANTLLEVSYIGYQSVTVDAIADKMLNITLREDTKTLEEVVVVGYGTMKKSDLTGSVASVKGKTLVGIPVRSASEALQGKVPGVTIMSTGGSPGTPPSVRIRGIGTVNRNDPLYVVDGFPQSDIGWLNQNDIESMEVLKDASSSAIYGSRGANGVVMITTKKGIMSNEQKMNINVEAYFGLQKVTKKLNMMNAEEFIDYRNLAYVNGTGKPWINSNEKQQMLNFLSSNFGNTDGTNWQNHIFQTAPMQNYNISITNGTKKSSIYSSLGFMNQDGIVKESDFKRISWRTNTENQLTEWAKLSGYLTIVYQERRNVVENTIYDGTIFCALTADPITPIYRTNLKDVPKVLSNLLLLDKIDASNPYTSYSPVFFNNRANPVAQSHVNRDNVWKDVAFRGGINLDIDLLSWLKYRGAVNTSLYRANPEYFTPSYYIGAYQNNTDGSVGAASYSSNYWVIDNFLTIDKTFELEGEHRTTFLLGNSIELSNSANFSATKTGIVTNNDSQKVIDAATKTASASGMKSNGTLVSYFGRLFHSWKNKYMFTATLRYDGSSSFDVKHKWGIFPSIAAAWSFGEEDFLKRLTNNTIYSGKIRLSWGQIGNQAIDAGAYRSTYSLNSGYYYFNGDFQLAGGKSYIGNPNVKWETTEQTNVGLDLGLFKDRIVIVADYFYKKTKDMLLQVPLPKYLGFTNNPWTNAGSIKNNGIEVGLTYKNNIGDLNYFLSGNFFSYNNEVLSLGGGQPLYGVGYDNKTITKTEVGQSVGYFYGLKTNGIFQSQQEIDNYKNAKGEKVIQDKARPGDLKFVDINEDGLITDADRTNLGDPFPKFTYGFNLGFDFKGIDFSMSFYGVYKNMIMNIKKLDLYSGTAYYNAPRNLMEKAWTETNKSNTQFRITTDNTTNIQVSDWLLEDGSYFQLKNVQIGYKFPDSFVEKLYLKEMRIWIGGYNLFTLTKYTGMTPEIADNRPLFNGVDIAFYPQARQYLMGFNIKF